MGLRLSKVGVGLMLVLLAAPCGADDSAAAVAVGGIVFKHEPRISMEKERLTIAQSKVTVEYEFLNESDQEIATEVGFPIPAYEFTEDAGGVRAFDDFRLWVDGVEVKYEVEAKAFSQGYDKHGSKVGQPREVTAVLAKYGVDIPSLGHYLGAQGDRVRDYDRLPAEQKKALVDAGLVDDEGDRTVPTWEVRKIYHWRQVFGAHKVLRVRHEYSPAFGFQFVQTDAFDEGSRARLMAEARKGGSEEELRGDLDLLKSACLDSATQKGVFAKADAARKTNPDASMVQTAWVDFILTTANNWKTPIKNFELRVERGPVADRSWYREDWDVASFCWGGPVKRVDATHYEASAKDLVPSRELRVLFVSLPGAAAQADSGASSAPASPAPAVVALKVPGASRTRMGVVLGLVVLAGIGLLFTVRRR